MTPEEIKKIAEEVAHLRAFDGGYFPHEKEIREDYEVLLQWLSERYYLAPKDKVNAYYNGDTFGELDFIELISTRRVLKSLFGPEIGKDDGNE